MSYIENNTFTWEVLKIIQDIFFKKLKEGYPLSSKDPNIRLFLGEILPIGINFMPHDGHMGTDLDLTTFKFDNKKLTNDQIQSALKEIDTELLKWKYGGYFNDPVFFNFFEKYSNKILSKYFNTGEVKNFCIIIKAFKAKFFIVVQLVLVENIQKIQYTKYDDINNMEKILNDNNLYDISKHYPFRELSKELEKME